MEERSTGEGDHLEYNGTTLHIYSTVSFEIVIYHYFDVQPHARCRGNRHPVEASLYTIRHGINPTKSPVAILLLSVSTIIQSCILFSVHSSSTTIPLIKVCIKAFLR